MKKISEMSEAEVMVHAAVTAILACVALSLIGPPVLYYLFKWADYWR